jgi:hypothetical protein
VRRFVWELTLACSEVGSATATAAKARMVIFMALNEDVIIYNVQLQERRFDERRGSPYTP